MSNPKTSSFSKILQFAKPYTSKLYFVSFWAIALAVVTALRPALLNLTIDNYLVATKKETNVIQHYFEEFMQYFFSGNSNPENLKILVIIMFLDSSLHKLIGSVSITLISLLSIVVKTAYGNLNSVSILDT